MIVLTLKVLASKLHYPAVVPPQKEANDDVEDPSNDHLRPHPFTIDIQRSDFGNEAVGVGCLSRKLDRLG